MPTPIDPTLKARCLAMMDGGSAPLAVHEQTGVNLTTLYWWKRNEERKRGIPSKREPKVKPQKTGSGVRPTRTYWRGLLW